MNRTYELIYVLKPDASEDDVNGMHKQVAEIVERMGGKIEKTESVAPWGRRRLAYEIDHKPEGIYHLLTFAAEPTTLDEVSRVLKITDGVMRHMAVRHVKGASTRPPESTSPEVPVAAAASTSQDSEPESTA